MDAVIDGQETQGMMICQISGLGSTLGLRFSTDRFWEGAAIVVFTCE